MSRIVEKNGFGFYSVINKPSQKELQEYYNSKYYQNAKGSYEHNYIDEEIKYFINKIEEKVHVVSKFTKLDGNCSVIDIGCGEGWVLEYFRKLGIRAVGVDYSSYGCTKFNPECASSVLVGDVYRNIEALARDKKSFELVWLDNVLEHVVDPFDLLIKCKAILSEGGVLMVEVPNDFSIIQNYLLENGHIDNQFWVVYPDHLSYFSKDGLENLADAAGFSCVFSMGDFPIDMNLMNPNTNYVKDRTKGKSCYEAKYRFENLIHSNSPDKVVAFYKTLSDLGIGRCLTSFFIKK